MSQTLNFGSLFGAPEHMDAGVAVIAPLHSPANMAVLRNQDLHDDGFVHGPIVSRHRRLADGSFEELTPAKRTEDRRIRLRATHTMEWKDSGAAALDRHIPMVLLHLLAACYDVRLQFADWWEFEPAKARASLEFIARPDELAQMLRSAMAAVQRLNSEQIARMAAILNLHGRILGMSSIWQQFAWQYSVVDGCWKQMKDLGIIEQGTSDTTPHSKRLAVLDKKIGGHTDAARLKAICQRRNNLIHECLEEGGPADMGRAREIAFDYNDLRRLSLRLLLHSLNVECGFVQTPWAIQVSLGTPLLKLANWECTSQ